jgi:hypothetical protein
MRTKLSSSSNSSSSIHTHTAALSRGCYTRGSYLYRLMNESMDNNKISIRHPCQHGPDTAYLVKVPFISLWFNRCYLRSASDTYPTLAWPRQNGAGASWLVPQYMIVFVVVVLINVRGSGGDDWLPRPLMSYRDVPS